MVEKTFWMMYLIATFSVMLLISLVSAWDYHQNNKNWAIEYPSCGGKFQSPVAIKHEDTLYQPYSDLFFDGYSQVLKNLTLMNTGHTLMVELPNSLKVYGGGLDGRYTAYEMHFHWGMNNDLGSEHMLEGHRFPMEVHILHYSNKYSNNATASRHPKGILAISFFIKSKKLEKEGFSEIGFSEIVDNVKMVNFKGNRYPLKSLKLDTFLPINQSCYYTYQGSLTYPPCVETLIWKIFKIPILISPEQIAEFRQRLGEHDVSAVRILLGNNFRPLQNLNNREIYRNCEETMSDVTLLSWSPVLLILCQVGIFMELQ